MLGRLVMRNVIFPTLFITLSLCTSSCQKLGIYTQADMDNKTNQIVLLQEHLQSAKEESEELNNRLSELQSASEELQENVDSLQTDNWIDVIPNIEASSQDVEYVIEETLSASENLNSVLQNY